MSETGAPPIADDLAAIRRELKEIRLLVKKSARFEEHWKAIDSLSQPILGLGLFALAAGVPMLVTGLQSKNAVTQWSNLVAGLLLSLMSVVLLTLPIRLQGYFLQRPQRMYSFFKSLEEGEGRRPLTVMREWAARQGDAGKDIRAAIAQADVLFKLGLGTVFLAMIGVVASSFAIISLLILGSISSTVRLLLLAALGLFLASVGWFLVQKRKPWRP